MSATTFAPELHIHQHHEEHEILPIQALDHPNSPPRSFSHLIEPQKLPPSRPAMATVLPPIQTRPQQHTNHDPSPPPPRPRLPPSSPPVQPAQQPILPPQQRPAPVPDVRERVTIRGIPSQTVVDEKLVIGHDTSTSVRSYTPLKSVGDGSFGTVVLADWHSPLPPGVSISPMQLNIKFNNSGTTPLRMVAIKRMKKRWNGGWAECSKLKELESLRRIAPHPNIIPLYDAFLLPDTKELYFVFECMEGNLYQLIKSRKGRPLAGGLVASIYRQVVEGLRHIHNSGYFHRDMKPENLLVTTTGLADYSPTSPLITQPAHLAPPEKDVMVIVKLADFGLAREISSQPPYTEYVSTRWYRAPEVLLRSTNYGAPVDMWALGTILAELVNLKPLFPGQTEIDQVQKITKILGNPTTRGEYGLDSRGRARGGGDWSKGNRMAHHLGYMFERTPPYKFEDLFDRNVPRSLIDCIADLIRYDPEKRLTAQDCRDHPYWGETENTQRAAISTQPTVSQVQQDATSSAPQREHQQSTRRRPSHIQIPRPPDTNASATSSNASLRAAVAGMGIHHSHSQLGVAGEGSSGFSRSHSRTHSTHHAMAHGLVLPQMSPRALPPSHSHPMSSGRNVPFFNNADVPPLPLPTSLAGPSSSHTSSSQQTSIPSLSSSNVPQYPSLSNSQSHPNLHLQAHRTPQDAIFSPVTPSGSPGPVFSPNPADSMSEGMAQYQQAFSAHYASTSQRGYTGRSHGSVPGTSGTSRSGELVEQMRELDLPPPVPPLPWHVNNGASYRESGIANSITATVGSDDFERRLQETTDDSAPMEISRGSLDLPAPGDAQRQAAESANQANAMSSKPSDSSQVSTSGAVSQPPPQQQAGGGKFHLGFGFGKKHKTWGLFGHAPAGSGETKGADGDAHMAPGANVAAPAPPVVSVPAVPNSLKRGPSNSAGSINELQSQPGPSNEPAAPPAPVDAKAAKKLAAQARKEEQRQKYEMRERQQRDRARAVLEKNKRMLESQGKPPEVDWTKMTAHRNDAAAKEKEKEKGKSVLRPQPSSNGLAINGSRTGDTKKAAQTASPETEQPQPSQSGMYASTSQGQTYLAPSYEHHLHRHKARRRDYDDDHSMSSSDVHSVSRMSMMSRSTVDSDPGPGRSNHHRMVLPNSNRAATIGPYGINRAISASNLRSGPNLSRGFSPSARSSTSLEQPFINEFDELGFNQGTDQMAFVGEPGSMPSAGDMHGSMNSSMVSPPMHALTLNGVPRSSQSPPLQDMPMKQRSHSRGRMQPPSFLGKPTLPTINAMHSPTYSGVDELGPDGSSFDHNRSVAVPSAMQGASNTVEPGSSPNGQTLPPFSHIASWAGQYNSSPTGHDS